MALTSTTLTTTADSIYTSAGGSAITAMYFCNTSDRTIMFNVFAVPNTEIPTNNRLIYYKVQLTAHDTYVIDNEKLILGDGDGLFANIIDPASTVGVGLSSTGWGTIADCRAVTWAHDLSEYLIVGNDGKVATSPTGEEWTYQSDLIDTLGWPSGTKINAVTKMIGNQYVAVGDQGLMASSSDGIHWANKDAIFNLSGWGNKNINAVANNGSIFMAVGDQARVATSINGSTWTNRINLGANPDWGLLTDATSVMWDGTYFVVGGTGGKIARSVDGNVWTVYLDLYNTPAWGTDRITTILTSGSIYLALTVDSHSAGTSTNGTSWTYNSGLADLVTSSTQPCIASATFRPGYGFYVFGSTLPNVYLYDGSSWATESTALANPNSDWGGDAGTGILWNSDRAEFIAVGYAARVATSPDVTTWTYRTTSPVISVDLPVVIATVSSIGI